MQNWEYYMVNFMFCEIGETSPLLDFSSSKAERNFSART
jgi:hypothetical protein